MDTAVRHPLAFVVAALVGLFAGGSAVAQGGGLFVTVPNPLTSEGVNRIKKTVNSRVNAGEGKKPGTVVFDFNPGAEGGKPAASTDYGTCYELATYISGLSANGVQTVAFVHARTTGHLVLPVLVCNELVMSRENETALGQIAGEGGATLRENEKIAYRDLFNRPPQFAVVKKMFDRDVTLAKAVNTKQPGAAWYIDTREGTAGYTAVQPVPFAQAAELGLFTADQAKELGLSKGTASTRPDVGALYGIPNTDDDILNGRLPDVYRHTLKGDVDGAMRESLVRIVKGIRAKKGNVLILSIECGGTDLQAARTIADDLRKAQTEEEPILVIGFIPDRAADAATFIAFGCTEIVMSRRKSAEDAKEAVLGDFEASLQQDKKEPGFANAHKASLKQLVESRGFPGLLVEGMFDRNLEIVRVRGVVNRSQARIMSKADWEVANKEEWRWEGVVKNKDELLKLTATRANDLGVARYLVDGRDIRDVAASYGFDADKIKEATPGWLDRFAEFLRMPVVTVLLVVLGFTGLILELKVPGLTVPGIIAALCFILVFWAQSRFSGETFVLAMLLFLLGLVLVGLEIFVLPGFGAPGIMGILCMLSGLALVTLERLPSSADEWGGLAVRGSTYLFAMMGAFALAFLIAKFLPKVPYANRLILAAPSEAPGAGEPLLPGASAAAEMLGAIGTTNTALRPAGVVRIRDEFVDVVSDGGFIAAGTRVQVIAVEGTRIVVKEV
jgi:membrane-bound serine protease (ClpP class)